MTEYEAKKDSNNWHLAIVKRNMIVAFIIAKHLYKVRKGDLHRMKMSELVQLANSAGGNF